MNDKTTALVMPDELRQQAIAFPDAVRVAIAKMETEVDGLKIVKGGAALADLLHAINAPLDMINPVQFGRVIAAGAIANKFMPRKKAGRPKIVQPAKNSSGTKPISLGKEAAALYRKIGDNEDRQQEYWESVEAFNVEAAAKNADLPDDQQVPLIEIGLEKFVRYVGSDGNLKSNRNRGVVKWSPPVEWIEHARKVMGTIDRDAGGDLNQSWSGNVFCYPSNKANLVAKFVAKLCKEFKSQGIQQAILLTRDKTNAGWWHQAAGACSAICFTLAGESKPLPHGCTAFYFGDRGKLFTEEFGSVGLVWWV